MSNRKWKKWTAEEISRLIMCYKSGLTINQIQETFTKTRSAGSVAVKINQLQKEGKIQYRQKSKQPKAMQEDFIPQKVIAREKIIIKLSKEIKSLKVQLESSKEALKAQLKSKHGMWNDPYKTKWTKTPPWVEAGQKAMRQQMSEKRVATSMRSLIRAKCSDIGKFLEEKNAQYGDSASNPIRVFSKADSTEQLKVRIDDKLSRLVRGNDSIESDEDVIKDLIGYLILLLIQYDTRASSEGNA